MNTKVHSDALELRVPPRPVKRLNRKAIIVLVGGFGLAVLLATMWGLRPPAQQKDETPKTEQKDPPRPSHPEGLAALPKDYSAVSRSLSPDVPELGPPLGELGRAIIKTQPSNSRPQARTAQERPRTSPFFELTQAREKRAGPPATFAVVASEPDITDTSIYAQGRLQTPVSPWQVMAGTLIRAALITGINSDLPGQILAAVTEPVYDTVTGRALLIPQGTRLIGEYASDIDFAQRRVHVVWTRMIMPDGSSITLEGTPAVDASGGAGLTDAVDDHWRRTFAGAALSAVLGIGAELAAPERSGRDGAVIISARESAQETINELGQELTRRNLDVKPTLTVRPGFPVNVLVQRDLVLRPYNTAIARISQ